MAVTDFLSGGTIPAGSAVVDVTTQQAIPDWYTNYAKQLLANQQALSSQAYNPLFNKRAAGFTPAQEAAFQQTQTGATSFMPALQSAQNITQAAAGQSALGTAQPYYQQAAGLSAPGAAMPNLQQAAQYAAASTTPTGMQAAAPYLGAAGRTSVQNIADYMNPYTEQVANRIGQLGARSLQEQLIPAIQDRMVAAGQFGGTRQAELMGRALRDTMEGVSAQQTAALQQGYGQGLTAAQADLTRQAQLASTAGTLGTQQQQALAQAGQQMGALGSTIGGLTQGQMGALTALGTGAGQLGGADISSRLSAAQQMAAQARQLQEQTLGGATALGGIGQQQQALNQTNLDLSTQNALAQQNYLQNQINAGAATLGAVKGAVPTAQTQAGIEPLAMQPTPTVSTGAQIGSALTGVAGLIGALGGLK